MPTIDPKMLDFANHRADASEEDIVTLSEAVIKYGFNSAFVNPVHVARGRSILKGQALVGTVISFPLGQDIRDVKVHAIREAIQAGADELDIVPDISRMKERNDALFDEELRALVGASRLMREDIVIKFIIETGLFLPEHFLSIPETEEIRSGKQIVQSAAILIKESGADFIKLCSGMGRRGVSADDVAFVRSVVGPEMKVKGAGGVDTKEKALALISAGANRLGTSHAVEILKET